MNSTAEKRMDFSIWDSVVNDRIIQFEDLEKKYRDRCRKTEALVEENEKLKERMEEASAKADSVCSELNEQNARIRAMDQEIADLKQWIANMENSFSWRITKPIRILLDKIKGGKSMG